MEGGLLQVGLLALRRNGTDSSCSVRAAVREIQRDAFKSEALCTDAHSPFAEPARHGWQAARAPMRTATKTNGWGSASVGRPPGLKSTGLAKTEVRHLAGPDRSTAHVLREEVVCTLKGLRGGSEGCVMGM